MVNVCNTSDIFVAFKKVWKLQGDLREYRKIHRGTKISTEDLGENLRTRSSPPSSSSSRSKNSGVELRQRLRDAPLGDGAHDESNRQSKAAAERQPYCLKVRRNDGMNPPIIAGEKLLLRTHRRRLLKPTL
jgi:hypothetical protein